MYNFGSEMFYNCQLSKMFLCTSTAVFLLTKVTVSDFGD